MWLLFFLLAWYISNFKTQAYKTHFTRLPAYIFEDLYPMYKNVGPGQGLQREKGIGSKVRGQNTTTNNNRKK